MTSLWEFLENFLDFKLFIMIYGSLEIKETILWKIENCVTGSGPLTLRLIWNRRVSQRMNLLRKLPKYMCIENMKNQVRWLLVLKWSFVTLGPLHYDNRTASTEEVLVKRYLVLDQRDHGTELKDCLTMMCLEMLGGVSLTFQLPKKWISRRLEPLTKLEK